jgi:hypothetical protein
LLEAAEKCSGPQGLKPNSYIAVMYGLKAVTLGEASFSAALFSRAVPGKPMRASELNDGYLFTGRFHEKFDWCCGQKFPVASVTLVLPVTSTYRSQECLRIIADAIFEDHLDCLDISDFLRGVAPYEHQIGILAELDRTDPVGQP